MQNLEKLSYGRRRSNTIAPHDFRTAGADPVRELGPSSSQTECTLGRTDSRIAGLLCSTSIPRIPVELTINIARFCTRVETLPGNHCTQTLFAIRGLKLLSDRASKDKRLVHGRACYHGKFPAAAVSSPAAVLRDKQSIHRPGDGKTPVGGFPFEALPEQKAEAFLPGYHHDLHPARAASLLASFSPEVDVCRLTPRSALPSRRG